jgi:hypothetical protein
MIIRTLFTDLHMADMLATVTNMTTYFLLTVILSFAIFTKVLGLRLFPCLPLLTRKNHKVLRPADFYYVSFYLYHFILPFLPLLISPLLSSYFNPS